VVKTNPQLSQKLDKILKDNDTKEWVNSLSSESCKLNYPKHVAEYLLYRNNSIKTMIKNFNQDKIKETKKVQEFCWYCIRFVINRR